MNWILYALLSAFFAGLTALFAKIGVENVPSNLATFVRTVIVSILALGTVLAQGQLQSISSLSQRTWLFLFLSAIATGLSWLCYFAALKYGPLSVVAPIDKLSFVLAMALAVLVLGEHVSLLTLAGTVLIVFGVLLTIPTVQDFIRSQFN